MKPDDKPKKIEDAFENPKLYVIVGGEAFPRTGLETAFIDYSDIDLESTNEGTTLSEVTVSSSSTVTGGTHKTGSSRIVQVQDTIKTVKQIKIVGCACNTVGRSICICNKVRVCGCVGYTQPSTRTVTTGCSCAPVH
ncbi:MAG: hypothetical protein LBV72_20120 [Tannerella sp.]|jgi:hypothetical protein|nr:hypothetical protein [Tannerella sp.]